MITSDQVSSVQELLQRANSVLVLIAAQPELDVVAAGSSLAMALSQLGKEVTVASPELSHKSYPDLTRLDLIKNEISNKNLVVSFDYNETAVEKVSYHIGEETGRFYLTVAPQKNQAPLNKDTVELGYAGANADMIFLVGVHDLEQLDHLYIGNEQVFADATVVSLHTFETEIGQLKLASTEHLNLSHLVAELARELQIQLEADAATNLLLSIESTTDHFRSLSITPEVLEISAWLMRQGARRLKTTSEPVAKTTPAEPTLIQVKPQAVEVSSIAKKSGKLNHQPGVMGKSS